jgi:hypothetical protein
MKTANWPPTFCERDPNNKSSLLVQSDVALHRKRCAEEWNGKRNGEVDKEIIKE